MPTTRPQTPTGDGLEVEQLIFTPAAGTFVEEAVMAEAKRTGFAFRDESRPSMVVVAATERLRDLFQASRHDDPDEGFPYTMLIEVGETRVRVTPPYNEKLEPDWRNFICWLMRTCRCTVVNEFETDLTEEVTKLCAQAPAG
jgi:hypothetical protein